MEFLVLWCAGERDDSATRLQWWPKVAVCFFRLRDDTQRGRRALVVLMFLPTEMLFASCRGPDFG